MQDFRYAVQRRVVCAATKQSRAPVDQRKTSAIQEAKRNLAASIEFTNRGGLASSSQRGIVEEAQNQLESLSPEDIDIPGALPGKWRVVYTTAPDVAPLLRTARHGELSLLKTSSIYQEFTADGYVRNIIQASVPYLLQKGAGVTAVVKARYEVRSGRRIALTFEEAGFGDIQISKELEGFIAPALLPRSWIMHRLLLAIKELTIPLRRGLPTTVKDNSDRLVQNVGSEYLLTYLDEDTLIGRQTGSGGTFIFDKEA